AGTDPQNPWQPTFYNPATGSQIDFFLDEDTNANGALDPGEDTNGNGSLDVYYTRNFWEEFDYSAHKKNTTAPYNAQFNGLDYLLNDQTTLPFPLASPWAASLGQTWNRFGHNHTIAGGSTANGLPREFTSAAAGAGFIGRFTHQ